MSTKVAGFVAIGLSLTTSLIMLLFVPIMIQKLTNIQSSLQVHMDEFNVSAIVILLRKFNVINADNKWSLAYLKYTYFQILNLSFFD